MKSKKKTFFVIGIVLGLIVIAGCVSYFLQKQTELNKARQINGASSSGGGALIVNMISPFPPPINIQRPVSIPVEIFSEPVSLSRVLPPPVSLNSALLSVGRATTTSKTKSSFNDILVAETNSTYASRGARYVVWPYPGDSVFKELYLVLPDDYDPIFSHDSSSQFIEFDGIKNTVFYLDYKQNTSTTTDARIIVETPTSTNEANHPLQLFDENDLWAGFSGVADGKEVAIEVIFDSASGLSAEDNLSARQDLLRAVSSMEIIW